MNIELRDDQVTVIREALELYLQSTLNEQNRSAAEPQLKLINRTIDKIRQAEAKARDS